MEDDNISLNSTSLEEYSENEEFEVEAVEAEKIVEGKKYYLLKWLGYAPNYNSWEPVENIQDPETLRQWEVKKLRQSKGLEQRFNLQGWEALVEQDAIEKLRRKERREAKRRLMGSNAPVSKEPITHSDTGSVTDTDTDTDFVEAEEVEEAIDDDDIPDNNVSRLSGFQRIASIFHRKPSIPASSVQVQEPRTAVPAQPPTKDQPLTVDTRNGAISEPPTKAKHKRARSNSSSDTARAPKRIHQAPKLSLEKFTIPKRANAPRVERDRPSRGKTATRGGSQLARNSRTLLGTSANPQAKPKPFGNARIRRKAELQARALSDREPDLAAVGGLYDPTKPEQRKGFELKSPRAPETAEEENTLFVPEINDTPGVFIAPPYLPSSKPILDSSRATCFFWDRAQRDAQKPDCKSGIRCAFLHRYETGVPIAQEPASEIRPTCYFWDLSLRVSGAASCRKGDNCNYAHEHTPGRPIAANPGVESIPTPTAQTFHPHSISSRPQLARSTGSHDATGEEDRFNFICHDWFEGRPCPDRATCKYVHKNCGLPIAARPKPSPTNPGMQPVAPQAFGPGALQHARSTSLDLREQERRSRLISENTWADRVEYGKDDQYYATCYYWNRDGQCNEGPECDYYHRFLDDAPIAPPSGPSKRICPFWENGACRYSAVDCKYRHSYPLESGRAPHELGPEASSRVSHQDRNSTANSPVLSRSNGKDSWTDATSNANDSPFHRSPDRYSIRGKVQDTCKFWAQGHCFKSQADCEFIHDYFPGTNSPQKADNRFRSNYARKAYINGKKKILKTCRFWLDGYCWKREEDCEFLHGNPPDGREPAGEGMHLSPERKQSIQSLHISATLAKSSDNLNGDTTRSDFKGHQNDSWDTKFDTHFSVLEPDLSLADSESEEFTTDFEDNRNDNTAKHIKGQPKSPSVAGSDTTKIESAIKSTSKMSLKDYSRRNSASLLASNSKEVVIGVSQTTAHSFVFDFRDLFRLDIQDISQEFMTLPRLRLDSICMAHDLEVQLSAEDVLWRSDLRLSAQNEKHLSVLETIADDLEQRTAAMSAIFSTFVFLVYPRNAHWAFLEGAPLGVDIKNRLRMAIVRCKFDARRSRLQSLGPSDAPPQPDIPPRKSVMKAIHGLEFKKLVAPITATKDGNSKSYHVFMMFPPHSDTEILLTSWLFASCKEEMLKLYTGQTKSAWPQFAKFAGWNGLILIHESMVLELFSLPGIKGLLHKTALTVHCISDSGTMYPKYPSDALNPPKLLGHISNTLLLPFGHAFLITPSLVVTEPEKVIDILNWFGGGDNKLGKYAETYNLGTWKIATCHGFEDYVLDLAISKAEEKQDFENKFRHKPSLEHEIEDRGLSFGMCKIRYKLHEKVVSLAAKGFWKAEADQITNEEISPSVSAPKSIDSNDEQLLVEWFASWAIQKMDKHRKFTVIGSRPEAHASARRMIEVEAEEDAIQFTQTSVEDQVMRMISDEAGRLPQGFRASESPLQGSPAFSPRVSFPMPKSTTASPQLPSPVKYNPIGNASVASSRRGSVQDNKYEPKPKSELVFEATPTWYDRLRKNGGGYPHLVVATWPQALDNLGWAKSKK